MAHVVTPEARALREELAQADGAIEHRAGDRKCSPAVRIEATIRQQNPWPYGSSVGTRQQEVGHLANALWVHRHVRAQEKNKAPLAALEAEVSGTPIPQVFRLHQHGRLWKLIRHRRSRTV